MTYTKVTKFIFAINEHTDALKATDVPVDQWSQLLAFILASKLDTNTRNKFERTPNEDELPTLSQLLTFLNSYISSQQWQTATPQRLATPSTRSKLNNNRSRSYDFSKPTRTTSFITTTKSLNCIVYKQPHTLYICARFKQLTPKQRLNVIHEHKHCVNCLGAFHRNIDCNSKFNCRTCNKRHHTLLQLDVTRHPEVTDSPSESPTSSTNVVATLANLDQPTTSCHFSRSTDMNSVHLGTAIVYISDSVGTWHLVRALLDSGSEASYITLDCLNRLQLPIFSSNTVISGFGNVRVNTVNRRTTLHVRSRSQPKPVYQMQVLVVNQFTTNRPKVPLPTHILHRFNQLPLADPDFISPGPIDLLIGADLYFTLLTGNVVNAHHAQRLKQHLAGLLLVQSPASNSPMFTLY